jgi:hypothetical protein
MFPSPAALQNRDRHLVIRLIVNNEDGRSGGGSRDGKYDGGSTAPRTWLLHHLNPWLLFAPVNCPAGGILGPLFPFGHLARDYSDEWRLGRAAFAARADSLPGNSMLLPPRP